MADNTKAKTPLLLLQDNSPSQRGVLSVDLSSAVPPANPRRGTGGSLVDPGAHSCRVGLETVSGTIQNR